MNSQLTDVIDSQFTKVAEKDNIHQTSLLVDLKGESYSKTFGPITLDSPIVIASMSKLFTTACILKLVDEQEIQFTDKISDYLKADLLENLHIYKKKDCSQEISINHLLTQTSGVAIMFSGEGELVGHSGMSGSFAFYWPHKELYMVEDLNQLDNPSLPVQFVMHLAMKLHKLI